MRNSIKRGKRDAAKYGDPVLEMIDDKSYLAGFFVSVLRFGYCLATLAFVLEMGVKYVPFFAQKASYSSVFGNLVGLNKVHDFAP